MKRPITAGVVLISGEYFYSSGNVSVVFFKRVAHSMVRRNAWVMPSFSIESCSVEIDASRRTRIFFSIYSGTRSFKGVPNIVL